MKNYIIRWQYVTRMGCETSRPAETAEEAKAKFLAGFEPKELPHVEIDRIDEVTDSLRPDRES